MLSESKKSDKFLINVVPTFHSLDSTEDFNNQFNACPEIFVQKYRLKCVIPGNSGSGLLAATIGGNVGGSTGSIVNISSPVAPSLRNTFISGAGDSMASINSEKSVGTSASAAVQKSPAASSSVSSVATLQKELKEARSVIERLRAVTKGKKISSVFIFCRNFPELLVQQLPRNGKTFWMLNTVHLQF